MIISKPNLNSPIKNILYVILSLNIINACVPVAQQGYGNYVRKDLFFEDHIYEENIKTVTLYPYTGQQRDLLRSVAIPFSQENLLQLSFDELSTESKSYYVKVVLCNADWTPSPVSPIDYIEAFNETLITDYDLSAATRIPFTNYRVTIPRVKIPGNYLIMVYRNKHEDDLVITRRFMVYTNQVKLDAEVRYSNIVSFRNQNQQVELSVSYPNYELVNPMANVKVLVRQNQRWDNTIYLSPTWVREDLKLLEYNYFNQENNFSGGNEFRAFDIRSINFPGMNVAKIVNTPALKEVFLGIDKPRKAQAYALIPDINGKFVVDNYDFQSDSSSTSDYLDVNFYLESPVVNHDVYIVGALTDWKLNPKYKMNFNQNSGRYEGKVLLKQGWYNYAYGIPTPGGKISTQLFEGSHFETENEYEVFVYYRPVGTRTDLIIGYFSKNHNLRK